MNRPDWCPHQDCIFKVHSQNLICVGKLPTPQDHDGIENTHRFCLDERETGHGVNDLQLNWGDAWNMIRILNQIKSPSGGGE